MKRLALLVPAAAMVAAAFFPTAGAHAANAECGPGTNPLGQPNVALGVVSIGGQAYVDDRNYALGNGLWIYKESNGVGGLQRNFGKALTYQSTANADIDNCSDYAGTPDQLIF